MAQYIVEFASFTEITIEADTESQAFDKAATMENDEIEALAKSKPEYLIWNDPRPTKEFNL